MIKITESDIKQWQAPIQDYINNNNVTQEDLRVIVLNHFPSDERVIELAIFLRESVPHLKLLREDKLLGHTRATLRNVLEIEAKTILFAKNHPVSEYQPILNEVLYNDYGDFEFSDLTDED